MKIEKVSERTKELKKKEVEASLNKAAYVVAGDELTVLIGRDLHEDGIFSNILWNIKDQELIAYSDFESPKDEEKKEEIIRENNRHFAKKVFSRVKEIKKELNIQ